MLGSGLLFVADVAVAPLARISRRKPAFVVSIIGCLAQVALTPNTRGRLRLPVLSNG